MDDIIMNGIGIGTVFLIFSVIFMFICMGISSVKEKDVEDTNKKDIQYSECIKKIEDKKYCYDLIYGG